MKLLIALLLALLISGPAFADLQVTFLDVGQGDAAIVTCDGESILEVFSPVQRSNTMNNEFNVSFSEIGAPHMHCKLYHKEYRWSLRPLQATGKKRIVQAEYSR